MQKMFKHKERPRNTNMCKYHTWKKKKNQGAACFKMNMQINVKKKKSVQESREDNL